MSRNQVKIKGILDFYGHKFMFNKKILDLGCGEADIGGVFKQLGADVTCVDARQENINIAAKKFPGLKLVRNDLDRVWSFSGKKFDLVLDIDLINYLQSYEDHLKLVCSSTDHLVLECAVLDSIEYKNIKQNLNIHNGSLNGSIIYPTSRSIEKILTSCGMTFRRLDHSQFNSDHNYDWIERNNYNYNLNNRRIWFCVKKTNAIQFTPKLQSSGIGIANNTITLQGKNLVDSKEVIKLQVKSNIIPIPTINKDNKIKVALCISGHLRTFEKNYPSVKEYILDKLDCDVFIHTWDTLGHRHRGVDLNLPHQLTSNNLSKIEQLYNPKKIIIEKPRNFSTTQVMVKRLIDNRDMIGVQSMFYKIEACNLLKKQYESQHGFTYDCVIRFRGDLQITDSVPIINSQDFNYLYLPCTGNFGGLNDQIAFGSSEIMNKYSGLFSRMKEYLDDGCTMNPEKLVQWHVEKLNIPIHRTDLKYVIVRGNGSIQDNQILENSMGFLKPRAP